MAVGYSGTPLLKKLGIKPGMTIVPLKVPSDYFTLLGDLPDDTNVVNEEFDEPVSFIHLFARNSAELHTLFPFAKAKLDKNGTLWASWIKKSSKLETDISGSDVRALGLKLGLVDIKICAVDEDWSGLKFMYRKVDR